VSAVTRFAPSQSEAISRIVAGGAFGPPMSGGAITLVETSVAYDGSVISEESGVQPHDAGHDMESSNVPSVLAGLLPPVKIADED
jgi:hypothetical protein